MKLPRNKSNLNAYWMVIPAIMVILIFFFGGISAALLQSFGWLPGAGWSRMNLDAYVAIMQSEDMYAGISLSLRVSFISTLLSAVIGTLLALGCFALRGSYRRSVNVLRGGFMLPLGIPHLAAAYIILLLLSPSGWLSRCATAVGFTNEISDFPIVTNDAFGWGMIIAYTLKETPFIFLCIYPVLERIRGEWLDAARMFGANGLAFARTVLLPLVMPALGAASLIIFAYSFSAFEIPYLLGVTYPEALPIYAYELYTDDPTMRPQAMAVGILMTVIPVGIGALFFILLRRHLLPMWKGW
jgi:putative spermidine/putrescine transport system permease protein